MRAGVSVTGVALDVATQRRPVWPSSAGPPHGCRPGLAYGSTRPRPIPRPLAGGRLAMLVGRRLHLACADAVHASPGPLLDPSPSSQHTYCRTATPGQGCPRGQPCGQRPAHQAEISPRKVVDQRKGRLGRGRWWPCGIRRRVLEIAQVNKRAAHLQHGCGNAIRSEGPTRATEFAGNGAAPLANV